MNKLNLQTVTGFDPRIDQNLMEDIFSFSLTYPYLINQNNKLLLIYFEPRSNIWLSQKLEKKLDRFYNF